ncbi:acylphosphatase [Marinicauda salina]|uniref:Acylphosphatase n=1 Tax=Marinicauda salina TaxID=2135793 RepID=A0A2U2BTW2_9PROT|nr:acylphosphatase [Marinicauda salina]PWE17465.1 acylphosphatase [Marinicauda salina]
MTEIAVAARITGRVQGVSFRAWTQAMAERRGVAGWVRNEPDGSVRALLMGEEGAVADVVRALHDGPPAAQVEAVATETVEPDPDAADFEITG